MLKPSYQTEKMDSSRKHFMVFSLLILLSIFYSGPGVSVVRAEITLKNHKAPILWVFRQDLSSKTSHAQDVFEAELPERTCINAHCLPEKTRLRGHLIEVKASKRFHRPGSLLIELDSMILPPASVPSASALSPTGTYISLEALPSADRQIQFFNPNATHLKSFLLSQIPGLALEAALPSVLAATTTLKAGKLALATLAIGATYDVGQEVIAPTFKNTSIPQRIGLGILNIFYIPDAIALLKRSPEAQVTQNKPVPLIFPKRVFNQLSDCANATVVPSQTPNTQSNIQLEVKAQPVAAPPIDPAEFYPNPE